MSNKFKRFDFQQMVDGLKMFISQKRKFPSMRRARDLNELSLAKWSQEQRRLYWNELLSLDKIKILEEIDLWMKKGWDPEETITNLSFEKFIKHPTAKFIFNHEIKESYTIRKRLKLSYLELEKNNPQLFEQLSIEVFSIKLRFDNLSDRVEAY